MGKKAKLGKKKADPFTRKEWYDIKAPQAFVNRVSGKTPVTRTTGTSEWEWAEAGRMAAAKEW